MKALLCHNQGIATTKFDIPPPRRRWTFVLATLLLLLAAGVRFSPIQPTAYRPGPPPALSGPTAPNNALRNIQMIHLMQRHGGEDVAVDKNGVLFTGTAEGKILRIELLNPRKMKQTVFADTKGRPLGLDFDAEGNLYVADSYRGLLRLSPEGKITVISTESGGLTYKFTDDVEVAPDGKVYFSDASAKYRQPDYVKDFMEARPYGRLMRYDPATGKTVTLMAGLYFANGVAVDPDNQFVLVNETPRYRVRRLWINGPKAGKKDILISNLPGFPDGISRGENGVFWLAVHSPRQKLVDTALHPRPWLKALLAWAPPQLRPKAVPYGMVLGLNADGKIVHNFQDPGGKVIQGVTSVQEKDGYLHLGTLEGPAIGRFKLP